MNIDNIIVSKETNEYLDRIEIERQRKIDEEQRRWYEMKQRMLGDSMKQEYPSTSAEAFESANEGLYYGAQMSKIRANGNICRVPYDETVLSIPLGILALMILLAYGVFRLTGEAK